ncbi:Crp/Fnr family transcriptional regulator [Flavobacterium lacus]|uniref:CRP-like cAMP-binding protein n=1 Tax=Flavobacterium lacus TaxID=1353778 RepID=A0A328WRB0_9FLAO|nr:Crp/Fnr family transcriptional regulator [Flavobacterium lacus]RAR47636.1 CRP-like cAMP-binding protein [Flavobacterium lacus]
MFSVLKSFLETKTTLNNDAVTHICSHFKFLQTNRNEILIRYNDLAKHYYFINKGCVRLFTITKEGQEISRYFAYEGTFVTALPSFIDQKPAEEFLQTIEKAELLSISRADFYKLVQSFPEFAKIYTEILELGFIVAQKRIYGFQGFDAMEKVKWVIKNQPQLLLRVSNKMAASYLGMSPATLSRIKSKL